MAEAALQDFELSHLPKTEQIGPKSIDVLKKYLQRIKERKQYRDAVRNEWDGKFPYQRVELAKSVAKTKKKYDGEAVTESYDDEIQSLFDYLSQTRDIELVSEKTTLLTGIVQKMLLDKPEFSHAKVVVMNKGANGDAFVCPDGTIFLSQSLFDLGCSNLMSEIKVVLAAER